MHRHHEIWVSATYTQGPQNVQADKESRLFTESTEWSSSQEIFNAI